MKYIRHDRSSSEANLQVIFVAGQVSTDFNLFLYAFMFSYLSDSNERKLFYQLWYEATHPIQKGDELVLGPKVPLQIRDMYNNNLFGRGDDDRSDRESGKFRHCQNIILCIYFKGKCRSPLNSCLARVLLVIPGLRHLHTALFLPSRHHLLSTGGH